MKSKIIFFPVLLIFLLFSRVNGSGIIFSGENPIVLEGTAGENNVLKGYFKIGNPEAAASPMVFSFIFSVNESFSKNWTLSLLSPDNNTVLFPGESVKVEFQCSSRKLPPGKYIFKIHIIGVELEERKGSIGVVEHIVTVEIHLRQKETLIAWNSIFNLIFFIAIAILFLTIFGMIKVIKHLKVNRREKANVYA